MTMKSDKTGSSLKPRQLFKDDDQVPAGQELWRRLLLQAFFLSAQSDLWQL